VVTSGSIHTAPRAATLGGVVEGLVPRLLVVEDHRRLGALLRDILPQAGFEVALVTGIESLGVMLQDFEPDVVLTDFRLRGEDGLDVCRIIRSDPRNRDVPVILHTAVDPSHPRLQEALALPRVSLLLKPAEYQTLVELIQQLLSADGGASADGRPGRRAVPAEPGASPAA
jgi:CheY-like chemotaxis protein